jgi:hypothetical protein
MAADLVSTTSGAIKLVRTPQGFRNFTVVFKAKLGVSLRNAFDLHMDRFIKSGVQDACEECTDDQLYLIHERLVVALQNEDDLLTKILEGVPDSNNGMAQFMVLQKEFCGSTVATSVINVFKIVTMGMANPVNNLTEMISVNRQLSTPFPDELLVALAVAQLPDEFATLADIYTERDQLPSSEDFLEALKRRALTSGGASKTGKMSMLTQAKLFCWNCDKQVNHLNKKCDQPPAGCDICGPKAWHMSKHCWVKNDKPLPQYWDEEKKKNTLQKRAEYKAKLDASTAKAQVNLAYKDVSFFDMIKDAEEKEMAAMRLSS